MAPTSYHRLTFREGTSEKERTGSMREHDVAVACFRDETVG
jgi:hypothetical protein